MTLIQNGSTPTIAFQMVASSDHIAGLASITPTARISKNGGASAATTNAATAIDNTNMPGWYVVTLTATETNTNGEISFHCTGAGADPTDFKEQVVAFNPNDAVRLGLTALPNAAAGANGGLPTGNASGQTTVATVATGAISSGSFAAGAIDAAAIATDAIGSAELAASAVTEIQTGLATAAALATVQADTDDIQTRLPAALVSGRMDASVGAMAADVLTASAIATDAIGANELAQAAADKVWATTTRAITDKAGFSLSPAGIQAIWDALTSALTTAGSVGALLVTNINATISSRLAGASYTAPDNATITAIASYVDTEVAAIKAKTDNLPASPAAVGSAMTLDLTQAVPTANTAQTLGDALNAARAQGFGRWVLSGTTLTLYAADGTTVVRTFTLDSATNPSSRT